MTSQSGSGCGRWFAAMCCAATMASTLQAGSQVLYVDDDARPDGDGASWSTAHRFLQDALDVAATLPPPVEILIGQGVYHPDDSSATPDGSGDPLATFTLMDGLHLAGGFAGVGAPDPDVRDPERFESVLSGDLLDNDVPEVDEGVEENAIVICTAVGDVTLDGLVIERGRSDGGSDATRGQAVRALGDASLVLIDCTTRDHYGAAAVHLFVESGDIDLTRCNLVEGDSWIVETLWSDGGGAVRLTDTFFSGRIFVEGPACTVELLGCAGADLRVETSPDVGSVTVTDCMFTISDPADAAPLTGYWMECSATDAIEIRDSTFIAPSFNPVRLREAATVTVENCNFDTPLFIQGDVDAVVRDSVFISEFEGVVASDTNSGEPELLVENCLFDGGGGGVSALDGVAVVRDTVFRGLTDVCLKGRLSEVTNCLFEDVQSRVTMLYESDVVFTDCEFRNNVTYTDLITFQHFGDPREATFVNCRIIDNTTTGPFAALLRMLRANTSMVNCTVAGNEGFSGVAWAEGNPSQVRRLRLANCAIENPSGGFGDTAFFGDDVRIDASVLPAAWKGAGVGNIVGDPLLDPVTFVPLPGSPCIDAGDNTRVPRDTLDLDDDGDTFERIPLDFAGAPRFQDARDADDAGCGAGALVDIGALEAAGVASGPVQPEDLDGDGVVGAADLAALLADWGPVDPDACSLADIDGDNLVGPADLAALLARFSP